MSRFLGQNIFIIGVIVGLNIGSQEKIKHVENKKSTWILIFQIEIIFGMLLYNSAILFWWQPFKDLSILYQSIVLLSS